MADYISNYSGVEIDQAVAHVNAWGAANGRLATTEGRLTTAEGRLTTLENDYLVYGAPLVTASGAITVTDATNGYVIYQKPLNVTRESIALIGAYGSYSLDKYTEFVEIYMNGTTYTIWSSNITGNAYRGGFRMIPLPVGTYSLIVRIKPQSGATITIPAYNHMRVSLVVFPGKQLSSWGSDQTSTATI